MKCKYCGAELKFNMKHPGWWDCDNCKTYWKFIKKVDDNKWLLKPYKKLLEL